MKPIAFAVLAVIAAPALAQSGKTLTKADFEASQVRKYARYDVNGDAKVTVEELMKVRPTRTDGKAWTAKATAKWLARRDGNGDGTVTTAEAVAFEMPRFDKMDADKDGMLTPQERAKDS